jgi:hypothetical protein
MLKFKVKNLHFLYGGKKEIHKNPIKINAIVLSSGTGKTTLANTFSDNLIDIDSIVHTPTTKKYMKLLRRKALISYKKGNKNAFDKVNNMNGKLLLDAIKKKPNLVKKIFLIHTSTMFGNAPLKINVIDSLKSTKNEIIKVANKRKKIDPLWGELTIKNWLELNAKKLNYKSIKKIVSNLIMLNKQN